jgi:hypothetical protein
LIEEAVRDGLFVVRQHYRLKDTTTATPEYWGLNGAPHFGATYSLGVKTAAGYYIDNRAAHPWLYDGNFDEYRDSRKFAPVVSQTDVRGLDGVAYRAVTSKDMPLTAVADSQLYYVGDSAAFGRGFIEDNTPAGEKKGWLAWAVSDKPMRAGQDTIPVSLLIYRTELNFVNGQAEYEVKNPATNKTVLGGIYVMPETTAVGIITFKLSGVLHQKDGKWKVIGIKGNSAAAAVPATEGRLTPVASPLQQEDNDKAKNEKKKKEKKK